jgi:adenylosuccinate lyase
MNELDALSPLDGRYAESAAPLRGYFSEFRYIRDRVRLELDFVSALSKTGMFPALTESEDAALKAIHKSFSPADAGRVRALERETRHDVKAIEYFLREKLQAASLEYLTPRLHFGLTSEDVNNIALAIALRDSRDSVMLPAFDTLLAALREFVLRHRALVMPARTHGQYAVPTTLGKEFAVFLARLKKARARIAAHRFEAKLTGAAGNLNALHAAAPHVDWIAFSRDFIRQYGLQPNLFTTQILPYDNWISYFDALRLANSIFMDLAQDAWRYISDGWLRQAVVAEEVGSSTMPQKVNPIDFENAEGNLGLSNALLVHYAQKLPVSRLQRDLSDATVRRTFGAALGHALVAWISLERGMRRIAPDGEKIEMELSSHWEIVSEGAQTILRSAGQSDAYEKLKQRMRGNVLTQADYELWLKEIEVSGETRERLSALSPLTYAGIAAQLAEQAAGEGEAEG